MEPEETPTLADKIYGEHTKTVDKKKAWRTFVHFNPKINYLNFKGIRVPLANDQESFFVNYLRNTFMPDEMDSVVENEFTKAINRGVEAINFLLEKHMPEYGKLFKIDYIENPINVFDYLKQAREDMIEAKNGKKPKSFDHDRIYSAFCKVRNYGLGNYIMKIDESPAVIGSLKHYPAALNWFSNTFSFSNPQDVNLEGYTHSWDTKAGIKVYGTKDKPVRSRNKLLDQDGEIKHASILMKLMLRNTFADEIKDYTGFEFIVEDDKAKNKLDSYFGTHIQISSGREDFKDTRRKKVNSTSSDDFNVTKFYIRLPSPREEIRNHPLGQYTHERIPVEVQILTLADAEVRRTNPDVDHDTYKKNQFSKIFPILFPEDIYRPIIDKL